jgi:hypothetical protein
MKKNNAQFGKYKSGLIFFWKGQKLEKWLMLAS